MDLYTQLAMVLAKRLTDSRTIEGNHPEVEDIVVLSLLGGTNQQIANDLGLHVSFVEGVVHLVIKEANNDLFDEVIAFRELGGAIEEANEAFQEGLLIGMGLYDNP